MHVPAKRLCDLCKAELTGPYVRMTYPLDQADRRAIEAQFPPPPAGSLFSFMVPGTPNSWAFDFCRGCVDGFIPMLADLKTAAVAQCLAERQRRSEVPIGEAEES